MSTRKQRKSKLLVVIVFVAVLLLAGKLFLNAIYTPVIVMYHSVGKKSETLDGYGDKLNVSRKAFQKQMKFLNDFGYKVISLTDLIGRIKRKEKIPHKTIAITFDDGLKNNFLNAYPILKRYDFPATIFVVTDFIGKDKFLDWDEIEIMQRNKISIGSHTASHRWLPSLTKKEVRKEFINSKNILENKTNYTVKTLSYPLGGFNKSIEKIAKETGYVGAVATNPGKGKPDNDPYALKRIRISMTSNNLFTFWIETSGYYTFIKEIRDDD